MKHPYILNVDYKKLETLGYYKSNPGCCWQGLGVVQLAIRDQTSRQMATCMSSVATAGSRDTEMQLCQKTFDYRPTHSGCHNILHFLRDFRSKTKLTTKATWKQMFRILDCCCVWVMPSSATSSTTLWGKFKRSPAAKDNKTFHFHTSCMHYPVFQSAESYRTIVLHQKHFVLRFAFT